MIESKPNATLLSSIRGATGPAHETLEARLQLVERAWSRERYVAFLRATLAVVEPLEPEIERRLAPWFSLSRAHGSPSARLRGDLERLAAPSGSLADDETVEIDSTARAFGAAYVLQGSMLGGQVVARALEQHLGLQPDVLTYLRPAGAPAHVAWREFLAALDAFDEIATDEERSATVAAAGETFAAFGTAFARGKVG